MNLVVDASVAIKWVLQEENREQARQLLLTEAELLAPEFLMIEVANVLRTKVVRGQMEATHAAPAIGTVRAAIGRFVPDGELAYDALTLAMQLKHSAYDCVYLACAVRSDADFITADERLLENCDAPGDGRVLAP